MKRSACIAVVLVTVLLSCREDFEPTAPEPPELLPLSLEISDGAHGGNPHFFWLPPMVPEPSYSGTFDASLSPVVTICQWTGTGCVTPLLAEFTMTAGPGSETVRVVPEDEHYIVNWHTKRFDLSSDLFYRISVSVDGVELGFADVDVVSSGKDKKDVDRGNYVALKNGSTLPIKFRIESQRLQGDPNDPAAGAIPQQGFMPRAEDYTDTHPELPGAFLSYNTLLLAFNLATTISEANEVLDQIEARIVGGVPGVPGEGPGILMLRVPTSTHEEMIALLGSLRENPHVQHAVQDALLWPDFLPEPPPLYPDWWHWTDTNIDGGNWGHKLSRVSQMWNLNEPIQKCLDKGVCKKPLTAVIDVGFDQHHTDLTNTVTVVPPNSPDSHGTHVAGIIGADFYNKWGVEGINPFADMVAYSVPSVNVQPSGAPYVWAALSGAALLSTFVNVTSTFCSDPRLMVVNMSMGFSWARRAGVDANNDPNAQTIVNWLGDVFAQVQRNLESLGCLPMVVTSAGNASGVPGFGKQNAKWNDPMANAALRNLVANIIVVENVQNWPGSVGDAKRHFSSNVNGHLSAPGTAILSTYYPADYDIETGTSMAAAHVTGLVGYLYTLHPGLPRPSTRGNDVAALLTASAVIAWDASPRVDAWATALNIDRFLAGRVLYMLLDIDDGTPDGNERVKRNGSLNTNQDNDGDGGIGDGAIDMRDFRRWRDWLLQVRYPNSQRLNGGRYHPKKDIDGDGWVRWPSAEENVYPRGDFNGDGRLSRDDVNEVPGLGELTDLEVFQLLFEDGWGQPLVDASELRDLIKSGDLEVDARKCLSQPDVDLVYSWLRAAGTVFPNIAGRFHFSKKHCPIGRYGFWWPLDCGPVRVLTAPVGDYEAGAELYDKDGMLLEVYEGKYISLGLGSDERWDPCAAPPDSL